MVQFKKINQSRCYLCGAKTKVIQDRLRHGEEHDVLKCVYCELVFLDRSHRRDLVKFYKKEYRARHSPVIGRRVTAQEMFDINFPFQQRRIEAIRQYLSKKKRVLEIGCSTGHFLKAIKPLVKEGIGIEFEKEHADFASKKLGLKIFRKPINQTNLPQDYFDVIFLYQVFEHLEDPLGFLATLQPYLKKNGLLVIEVPNIEDPLLNFYRVAAYKKFYYHNAHLFYYSATTLLKMLSRGGFRGRTFGYQLYNLLNHLHWIFTGQPQKSASLGIGAPDLAQKTSNRPAEQEINAWLHKANHQYQAILEKHYVSDCLLFIGRKK